MGYNDPSKPAEGSMAYPSAPPPAYQPYEVNGIKLIVTRVSVFILVDFFLTIQLFLFFVRIISETRAIMS